MEYAISILVNNKPGVLVRMTQIFARRGYNIDSLVVSPAHNHQFSRLTINAQGAPDTFDQIILQLNKLVDVVHATHHNPSSSVERELALFKVKVAPEQKAEVFQYIDVFRAKVIDMADEVLSIEVTGSSDKIDALEKLLSTISLLEMVRSGKLVMARGTDVT
ncbi:MAG: acetolactate synthase-1/3 small subunit [bacterium]|jgi:acetolactate synthase-1/3 small subunit